MNTFPLPSFSFHSLFCVSFSHQSFFLVQTYAKQVCSLSRAELSLQVLSNSNPFALSPLCLAQKSAFSPTSLCRKLLLIPFPYPQRLG